MVVSLYFGGKSNMFQIGKMYLLRSPVHLTTIVYLKVVISQIWSTILLMGG